MPRKEFRANQNLTFQRDILAEAALGPRVFAYDSSMLISSSGAFSGGALIGQAFCSPTSMFYLLDLFCVIPAVTAVKQDLSTGTVAGIEILGRWRHGSPQSIHGPVTGARFIREEAGS